MVSAGAEPADVSEAFVAFSKKFRITELKVFDTEFWTVSVRPAQVTIGSSVLSLRRPCSSLGQMTDAEGSDFANATAKLERLLSATFAYERINYLCLMLVDHHLHFHVLPRFSRPVQFVDNVYVDSAWPGPIDISSALGIAGLELEVLRVLRNNQQHQQ